MAVCAAFKRLLSIAAVAVAAVVQSLYAVAVELPPDEAGLGGLLEEEIIDSFQYEQLMIYYALPVSVPQGELGLLIRIFPDIEGLLPTSEELEAYQPFDNRQIRRLFNDFPALADLEPVLRFNLSASERPANGEVVIGINKSSMAELRGHRVRFRYGSRYVSTEGSAAFSDSGAMWRTRRVDVSLPGRVTAQAGNFKRPVPGELFFGRFSPVVVAGNGGVGDDGGAVMAVSDNNELIANNWLYGGSDTWNGVAVSVDGIPNLPALGVTAFYHRRGGESGAGGSVDYRPGKQVRINAAFTEFDSVNTAHLYAEYRGGTWRSALETGLPVGYGDFIPAVSYRLNYRAGKESSAEYHLISYPDNFRAPSSGVKRRLLSEVGEREPSRSPSIRKHALRFAFPLSIPRTNAARLIPEVDFSEHQGMIRRVQGRADLRVRVNTNADVAIRHTARIFTTGADSVLHTSTASLKLQTGYPVSISLTAQSVYGFYRNPRNAYTFELTYVGLPNTVLTPFISGRYVTDHQYRFGLKTELHLYRKTWTGIALEVPVDAKGVGHVYIRGSSSYAF